MPFLFSASRSFSAPSIRTHAPGIPGLFGVSNSRQWILIGLTNDIQATLLRLVSEPNSFLSDLNPTQFAFEPCDAATQASRQDRLVLEYEPVANRLNASNLDSR